ncbi:uncharacterized protein LOC128216846 isoform X1 [Mya arenaria]|uniref:uncharacterized protein LOC128216846 isoform X1 n=1 Tax=Mya arenaria TaxID=6604 RepID=UPI0022DF6F8F|nr:uncharacterized protein LOC128216846 isoform X1 [Mya arenaria]
METTHMLLIIVTELPLRLRVMRVTGFSAPARQHAGISRHGPPLCPCVKLQIAQTSARLNMETTHMLLIIVTEPPLRLRVMRDTGLSAPTRQRAGISRHGPPLCPCVKLQIVQTSARLNMETTHMLLIIVTELPLRLRVMRVTGFSAPTRQHAGISRHGPPLCPCVKLQIAQTSARLNMETTHMLLIIVTEPPLRLRVMRDTGLSAPTRQRAGISRHGPPLCPCVKLQIVQTSARLTMETTHMLLTIVTEPPLRLRVMRDTGLSAPTRQHAGISRHGPPLCPCVKLQIVQTSARLNMETTHMLLIIVTEPPLRLRVMRDTGLSAPTRQHAGISRHGPPLCPCVKLQIVQTSARLVMETTHMLLIIVTEPPLRLRVMRDTGFSALTRQHAGISRHGPPLCPCVKRLKCSKPSGGKLPLSYWQLSSFSVYLISRLRKRQTRKDEESAPQGGVNYVVEKQETDTRSNSLKSNRSEDSGIESSRESRIVSEERGGATGKGLDTQRDTLSGRDTHGPLSGEAASEPNIDQNGRIGSAPSMKRAESEPNMESDPRTRSFHTGERHIGESDTGKSDRGKSYTGKSDTGERHKRRHGNPDRSQGDGVPYTYIDNSTTVKSVAFHLNSNNVRETLNYKSGDRNSSSAYKSNNDSNNVKSNNTENDNGNVGPRKSSKSETAAAPNDASSCTGRNSPQTGNVDLDRAAKKQFQEDVKSGTPETNLTTDGIQPEEQGGTFEVITNVEDSYHGICSPSELSVWLSDARAGLGDNVTDPDNSERDPLLTR